MDQVNLAELKANLSAYAKRVKQGERVIVCERNKPIAELRPLENLKKKQQRPGPGQFKDQIQFTDDFFASDVEIESDWFGDS